MAAAAILAFAGAQSPPNVEAELVVDGLTSPVQLTAPPDDPRRFVVEQTGQIRILQEDGTLADTPFLDLSDRIVTLRDGFEERGLLGLAFHPEFADNGRFYVHYSAPLRERAPDGWDHTARISEFRVPADSPEEADPNSERVLLRVDHPNRKTNAGALAFGPDGYLYAAIGEGGGAHGIGEVAFGALEVPERGNVWDALAQDVHTPYGKILRLDVDHGWPGYAVPESNPFVGTPGMDEIYAWGFRNHYRMAFDHEGDGALYVAAVSESISEAVYRVDGPGNYGWPIREGTHCYDRQAPLDPPEDCSRYGPEGWRIHDPVVAYYNVNVAESDIDAEPRGTAVVGAQVYRGDDIPELRGRLLVADYSQNPQEPSGTVFVAGPEGDVSATWPLRQLVQVDARAQGLGVDVEGEAYLLTREAFAPSGDTGRIYRLVPASDDGDEAGAGASDGQDAASADAAAAGFSFTAAQAEQGSSVYDEQCQSCHADDLRAQGPFPPLTGSEFFGSWEGRPVSEMYAFIRGNMPLGSAGSLSDEAYAEVMAYWLQRHGYQAGEAPLPGDPAALPEDVPVEDRR
ncbi:MAG: PQQ-dependent sugar dehydrogenase [Trueperaceae bacterium]|nr:PQQ-dependent sugar dehydrogenase [Trueperaceae bacterium]